MYCIYNSSGTFMRLPGRCDGQDDVVYIDMLRRDCHEYLHRLIFTAPERLREEFKNERSEVREN